MPIERCALCLLIPALAIITNCASDAGTKKPRAAATVPLCADLTPPRVVTVPSGTPEQKVTATQAASPPPPSVIRGAHVIAEAPADTSPSGAFDVLSFDDRIWIVLCSLNYCGCDRPQIKELKDGLFAVPNVGLQGLPQLGVVNLYGLVDLPFRNWVLHEENPPFDDPRAECEYDSLMLGARDIAQTIGTFPENAWMVVRVSLDHSGVPTDELFHWKKGHWRRVLHAKAYGDTLLSVLPWQRGVAVVRRQGNFGEFKHSILHLTGQREYELLPPQTAVVRAAVIHGNLIAIAGLTDSDQLLRVRSVQVLQWQKPERAPQSRTIPVAQGEDAMPMEVNFGDRVEIAWNEENPEPKTSRKITIELDGTFSDSLATKPPFETQWDVPSSVLALPPPYQGEANAEQEWTVRGRHFWLVKTEGAVSKWLLLSDQPVNRPWAGQPVPVALPKVEKCERLPTSRRR